MKKTITTLLLILGAISAKAQNHVEYIYGYPASASTGNVESRTIFITKFAVENMTIKNKKKQ